MSKPGRLGALPAAAGVAAAMAVFGAGAAAADAAGPTILPNALPEIFMRSLESWLVPWKGKS